MQKLCRSYLLCGYQALSLTQGLLEILSVAEVPLAQPALAVICPLGTRPIKELRRASLLMMYEQRLHTNAVVASAVIRALTPSDRYAREEVLIRAYMTWLYTGMCSTREAGGMVADLAMLLLKHYHLLAAAQLLMRYGWLAFNLGHTRRLAELAMRVLEQEWENSEENRCGALLLRYFLVPFLGQKVDERQKVVDYQHIRTAFLTDALSLHPSIEVAVVYTLMTSEMNALHFDEAQALYDECYVRLQIQAIAPPDLQGSLMEKQAWLWARWSEYVEELGDKAKALTLEEQAVALYREMVPLLTPTERCTPLEQRFLQKRLARALNNLAYQLNRRG